MRQFEGGSESTSITMAVLERNLGDWIYFIGRKLPLDAIQIPAVKLDSFQLHLRT